MILDAAVAIAMVVGVIRGVKRGFLISLFSLGGLLLGLFIGWQFAPGLVAFFEREFGWLSALEGRLAEQVVLPRDVGSLFSTQLNHAELAEVLLTVVAFLLIYLVIRGVAETLGRVIRTSISWGILGTVDRILGSALGLVGSLFGMAIVFGVIVAVGPAVPALSWLVAAIEDSSSARGLARLFFAIGPLRVMITDTIPTVQALWSWEGIPTQRGGTG